MNLKNKFLPGEWDLEPDHEFFEYKGYACEISRCPFVGVLRGYVRIPRELALRDLDWYEIIETHGGITYHNSETDTIGFDCGHAGLDYIPSLDIQKTLGDMIESLGVSPEFMDKLRNSKAFTGMGDPKNYRNIEYVRNECRSIVDQLEKLKE